MEFRINARKLTLAHHLTNLPDSALARQVYDEQVKLKLPGLGQEISSLVIDLGIPSIKKDDQTKQGWKNLVKRAVKKSATSYFKENMGEKLSEGPMKDEPFGQKEYLKSMRSNEAKTNFSMKSKMLPFKFNYKMIRKTNWKCGNVTPA